MTDFAGIWTTSFGSMALKQNGPKVEGVYGQVGEASLKGNVKDGTLKFRYLEPTAKGEGSFELSEDGTSFQGKWRADGTRTWALWQGKRIVPVPGLVWLVVLEAYWQRGLGEKEYAFGNMLREFFARVPNVEVRQRFFTSEAGLARWCREVLYLAEPVVLVFAAHGTAEGLTAHGEVIHPEPLVEALRDADNIKALHFSSCLMMDKGPAGKFAGLFHEQLPFPISGYTTSVDWTASALIEFTYLDMVLARGLDPQDAADQVTRLLSFAGDQPIDGSPYPPACFRFWPSARGAGKTVEI